LDGVDIGGSDVWLRNWLQPPRQETAESLEFGVKVRTERCRSYQGDEIPAFHPSHLLAGQVTRRAAVEAEERSRDAEGIGNPGNELGAGQAAVTAYNRRDPRLGQIEQRTQLQL